MINLIFRPFLPSEDLLSKIHPYVGYLIPIGGVILGSCGWYFSSGGAAEAGFLAGALYWILPRLALLLAAVSLFALLIIIDRRTANGLVTKRIARIAGWLFRRFILSAGDQSEFLKALRYDPDAFEWMQKRHPDWLFLTRLGKDLPLTEFVLEKFTRDFEGIAWKEAYSKFQLQRNALPEANTSGQVTELFGELINRLRSMTYIWFRGERTGYARPHYVKGISNPIGEEYITKALRHSFLYRLNFMMQLGTLNLGGNLDAAHNRLAHACGTAECAALIIEAVERRLNTGAKRTELSDESRAAVIIGALIHDSFQGPFGHSLDMLKSVMFPEYQ